MSMYSGPRLPRRTRRYPELSAELARQEMSQADLCRQVGISPFRLSRLQRSGRDAELTPEERERIAAVLDRPALSLFAEAEQRPIVRSS